jgi:predicted metal-dependent TIM-barrel fold hydrolase
MLPQYMQRERVVGMGEVGLESRSKTCPDLGKQTEILKAQLKIAKEYSKPVVFHLPPMDRAKWIDQYLRLIDDVGLERGKAVVTHTDATTAKIIIEAGCIAGISAVPMRRMTPEDAAKIVADNDLDQVLVSSDTRLRHRSDPLGVPRAAFQMRRLGFTEEEIKRVFYDNPCRVFDLT